MSNLAKLIVIFVNAKKMENSNNNDLIIWLICQQISTSTCSGNVQNKRP